MDNNQELLKKLSSALDQGRLGHAVLFVAQNFHEAGLQKELRNFIMAILCTARGSSPQACRQCNSCEIWLQFEREGILSHPDAFWLSPSERGSFVVDDIKRLLHSFSLRVALSPYRVAILEEVQGLSSHGQGPANALLKLLEEPRPETFLILLSSNPEGILPTIRSRCQSFRLFSDPKAQVDLTCLEGFETLSHWLENGAQSSPTWQVPASQESYWKDKPKAAQNLKELYFFLWNQLRTKFAKMERQEALRCWDFLNAFENLLQKLRLNSQGHLQWIQFESSAKTGNYEQYD